jgi:hypothetical protein
LFTAAMWFQRTTSPLWYYATGKVNRRQLAALIADGG